MQGSVCSHTLGQRLEQAVYELQLEQCRAQPCLQRVHVHRALRLLRLVQCRRCQQLG